MSNDNLQGMPPKPPVQPNQPPAPPTNPTMSRLTPPVPPHQTANTGTTMPSQPPAPPSANSTQPAPQPQQQDSIAWQQLNYTAPPTTPNSQNNNEQSSIDNFLANEKFKIKDLIELKSKPEYNIGNFIGQIFCSFWRFDARSTRRDWWIGQVVLLLILTPASTVLRHEYYIEKYTTQESTNPLLLLLSAVVAIYVIIAEIALTARRLRDTGSSPWMMLMPLITIPATLLAGIIAPLIGPLLAFIMVMLVEIISVAIPLITSAFTPSIITNNDKPRYMVFHWEKLFG